MISIQRFLRHAESSSTVIARRLDSGYRQQSNNEPDRDSGANTKHDVITLYKNLIHLSREWPTDLRPQIKSAFMKNKDVQDVDEIRKLIGRGEYVCREITATYHLRKYRAMKRRYYSEDREKQLDEMFKNYSQ